jgi:hypothetical protein
LTGYLYSAVKKPANVSLKLIFPCSFPYARKKGVSVDRDRAAAFLISFEGRKELLGCPNPR